MKISIVMTTYNGEQYVKEQLESILNQTVPADEVLIFDDRSTDDTVNIVKEFICANELLWDVSINEMNKGWQRNFIDGISRTTGDIVFLADQDDIWHPQKIEIMKEVFEKDTKYNLAVCQYEKFSGEYRPIKEQITDHEFKQLNCTASNSFVAFPGCTFAFKKTFFNEIKEAWSERLAHDALIYLSGWLSNSIAEVTCVLHYFRRHEGSASRKGTDWSYDNRLARINRMIKVFEYLENVNLLKNAHSEEYFRWLCLRRALLSEASLVAAFRLIKLLQFYRSKKTWLADLIVAGYGIKQRKCNNDRA